MCYPSPTSHNPADSAVFKFQNLVFFHGTSKRSARKILKEEFRDWSWMAETPLLKYKGERGLVRWMHGGFYVRGTYLTCDWRSALYFGLVLFRVEMETCTRIVHLDMPPEPKILYGLKREFGHEFLKVSPWKVLPRNKRLKLEEAIQLARHHASKNDGFNWTRSSKVNVHEALMLDLRNILVRYGIHGWGEITDLNEIVIFATDRLKAREVVLSMPTQKLRYEARCQKAPYTDFQSIDALVSATRSARNRGAANTLRGVNAANAVLKNGQLPNDPNS